MYSSCSTDVLLRKMPSALQGTFHTYRPIRRLGQGAFGEVSLASVLETGEVVALKRIHIRNTSGIPDVIVREIKALQSVSHPNVVALLDVFPKGQAIYLVQEYCTTDLAALLRRLPAPPPERIAKGLMLQMCRGLEALHAEGIMHRDIKPSNTLLSASSGTLKLADCGLARPHDGGERPAYTHAVATRWYRAPELLYGARCYGPAVDTWALGLVWAELLGLSPLVPGDNDIDQLGRVIATFGSMEAVWPVVCELPDWGKIAFPAAQAVPLGRLLPGASGAALDFLAQFLRYDPSQRITASDAVRSAYLTSQHPPPADEAEIAQWLAATLEAAEAATAAARRAAAATGGGAARGGGGAGQQQQQQQQYQQEQSHVQQQAGPQQGGLMHGGCCDQQELWWGAQWRQPKAPLAACWESLPLI
ncbi:hypothetical protein Agub_g7981 [Astrephomene gubernaculifera]|uniref:cyclin-dependent kinase n=1 Tax=Astrephomene gubernaculifera TaxID=47775 RepID=A0AAD3HM30_9CHLO|nr:hypothetical protein Agub_g7981 [Astrephomene gubernaculifera]